MLWDNVYFIRHGATLVAADNPGDARKGESLLNALPPILPVEGVLAIQVRPAALTDTYGPLVREQMDVMVNDPDAPAQMEPFAKEYFDAYLQVAAQVDEVVLGVGVANDKLNLHYRAAPIAGTTLARWMDTIRAPGAASAVVALPGALVVSAVNMGDFNMIAGPYLRFMEKALKSMPPEIPRNSSPATWRWKRPATNSLSAISAWRCCRRKSRPAAAFRGICQPQGCRRHPRPLCGRC